MANAFCAALKVNLHETRRSFKRWSSIKSTKSKASVDDTSDSLGGNTQNSGDEIALRVAMSITVATWCVRSQAWTTKKQD